MRRFGVFIVGFVLGAVLFWACAFAGVLGFASVEGAVVSAVVLLALVVLDLVAGGLLARVSSTADARRSAGIFAGGSVFLGALVSGLVLGAAILLDAPPEQRSFLLFLPGAGLGLVYGMVLGMPAVVGATIVELRTRAGGPK